MTTSGKDFNNVNVVCNVVTFCIDDEQVADNHRKLPEKRLSVLLTKQGNNWSLLNGNVNLEEDMDTNALNVIEDNLSNTEHTCTIQNLGAFTSGNTVAIGYIAKCSEKLNLKESKSSNTCWFTLTYEDKGVNTLEIGDKKEVKKFIELTLRNKENNIEFTVGAELIKTTSLVTDNTSISVTSGVSDNLTKYECELLVKALQTLRDETITEIETIFNFLPKYFTFKEFQSIYELFIGREVDASAFRRKVANKIEETEQREYSGSRKAKLCVRKIN